MPVFEKANVWTTKVVHQATEPDTTSVEVTDDNPSVKADNVEVEGIVGTYLKVILA